MDCGTLINMHERRKISGRTKAALARLQAKGFMWNTKLGFRHIIRTDGSVTEHGGLTWVFRCGDDIDLPNWHPGTVKCNVRTVYNGRYAEVVATYGVPGWTNSPCDVSNHFPLNPLATGLIHQPDARWISGRHRKVCCYGDAVLCTDIRTRWIFSAWQHALDEEEMCFVDDNLTTKRRLLRKSIDGRSSIFFDDTPNEDDLVYLVMRFA